jgi:hypothetical protein
MQSRAHIQAVVEWNDITDQDPISLEPLCSLPYPPFQLGFWSTGEVINFDGNVLCQYLVATRKYVNPVNHKALTAEDCTRLDEYLHTHNLQRANVRECFDEIQRRQKQEEEVRRQRIRKQVMEATFKEVRHEKPEEHAKQSKTAPRLAHSLVTYSAEGGITKIADLRQRKLRRAELTKLLSKTGLPRDVVKQVFKYVGYDLVV